MREEVLLRDVEEDDVETFFLNQLDAEANALVGFVPRSREEFFAHWAQTSRDPAVRRQTIVVDGRIAGHVGSFERHGRREVGYRIGREFWNRGVATRALTEFLKGEATRPLYAGVGKANDASIRVLEKCGFVLHGPDRYTNKAGKDIEGYLFSLAA